MRELIIKYKAEKVCHEEMVKIPLVDLKVLEDGSFRICMDYRKLSEIATRNHCHQMRAHEEEIPKIYFRTRYGHFKFMVMPFGLTKAPAVFMEDERVVRIIARAVRDVAWLGPTDGEKRWWWIIILDRIWILMVGDVRILIMEEAHATKYSVRPEAKIGESKMIGLEMEQEMTKVVVIKERLKEAKDRQ
nr:hypothetical protein [Tanacetum cinerariifolium]